MYQDQIYGVPIFLIDLDTLARVTTDTDYSLILGSGLSVAQTISPNLTKKYVDHNSEYVDTDDKASAIALPQNTQHMKVLGDTLRVAATGSNTHNRQRALGMDGGKP